METGNEIKGFNIAEALKYAPKGLKLYSPIFGEVKFEKIDDDNWIQVRDKYNNERWFYKYGTYFPSGENNYTEGECLLFPSTHCRTWNHWQNTLFLESIGSVCVDTITGYKYILENNGTFFSDGPGSGYSVIIEDDESNYFLNSRYASPEETKEFFEELEKNGYKWDGKMVVKKEDKQKFYVGDNVYKWDGKDLKKEQNKPKFHEGDWITDGKALLHITKFVIDYGYELKAIDGEVFHFVSPDLVEANYRLWTVQDAHDGDLIYVSTSVKGVQAIFHKFDNGIIYFHCYLCKDFTQGGLESIDDVEMIYPLQKTHYQRFFQKMHEAGYEWDGETVVKKEVVPHKFKVGDIVKFDRPSATVKREILSIDFENERYLTRRTDIGGAIKEFIYFCEQDDYVIVDSHNNNLSLEVKVSMMADEILALKEKLLALEKLAKDSEIRIDALECGGKPFQCPDKAGDNVTL